MLGTIEQPLPGVIDALLLAEPLEDFLCDLKERGLTKFSSLIFIKSF